MKTASYYLLSVIMFFGSSVGSAAEEGVKKTVINIVTAQETGTYHQIATDIQKIAPDNLAVKLSPSVGSFTNALLIATSPDDNQMGMLQLDIFNSLQGELAQAIKIALPLYHEELHLVTNNEAIKTFADLKGKRVAVDIQGTGTHSVVKLLLEKAGLEGLEHVYLGGATAVNALKEKQIEAMFYVIGHPAPLFKTLNNAFHLVPITLSLGDGFQQTVIPADTYAWQAQEVATLSIPVALVVHNYETQDENC
ncbi:MAG: TAXI family TRAP transporter solute-binding subunit, partial [Pseudomonadota bacterium]|nr:TAXI family TRAP transporter solute-binding subunit [Pseudomonadota bacterium]